MGLNPSPQIKTVESPKQGMQQRFTRHALRLRDLSKNGRHGANAQGVVQGNGEVMRFGRVTS